MAEREPVTAYDVWYVLTRPGVLGFLLLGALLVGRGAFFPGVLVFALVAIRVGRRLADPFLPVEVRLRRQKRRLGIRRPLSSKETAELVAIDAYGRALREAGGGAEVSREPVQHAWQIIARAGQNDASDALAALRASLPSLAAKDEPPLASTELNERLAREVAIINKTARELNRM